MFAPAPRVSTPRQGRVEPKVRSHPPHLFPATVPTSASRVHRHGVASSPAGPKPSTAGHGYRYNDAKQRTAINLADGGRQSNAHASPPAGSLFFPATRRAAALLPPDLGGLLIGRRQNHQPRPAKQSAVRKLYFIQAFHDRECATRKAPSDLLVDNHSSASSCLNQVRTPLRTSCIAFLLVISIGGHWALLQSVAWMGMVINFSQTETLAEAVSNTFDGKHPCKLCKVVARGKASEQKQERLKVQTKLEPWVTQQGITLFTPRLVAEPFPSVVLPLLVRDGKPPVPPPRPA